MEEYYIKYLKYKTKYLALQDYLIQVGSAKPDPFVVEFETFLNSVKSINTENKGDIIYSSQASLIAGIFGGKDNKNKVQTLKNLKELVDKYYFYQKDLYKLLDVSFFDSIKPLPLPPNKEVRKSYEATNKKNEDKTKEKIPEVNQKIETVLKEFKDFEANKEKYETFKKMIELVIENKQANITPLDAIKYINKYKNDEKKINNIYRLIKLKIDKSNNIDNINSIDEYCIKSIFNLLDINIIENVIDGSISCSRIEKSIKLYRDKNLTLKMKDKDLSDLTQEEIEKFEQKISNLVALIKLAKQKTAETTQKYFYSNYFYLADIAGGLNGNENEGELKYAIDLLRDKFSFKKLDDTELSFIIKKAKYLEAQRVKGKDVGSLFKQIIEKPVI